MPPYLMTSPSNPSLPLSLPLRHPKSPAHRDCKIRDQTNRGTWSIKMRWVTFVLEEYILPFLLRYPRHQDKPVRRLRRLTKWRILTSIVRQKSIGFGTAAILLDLCYRNGPLIGWIPIRLSVGGTPWNLQGSKHMKMVQSILSTDMYILPSAASANPLQSSKCHPTKIGLLKPKSGGPRLPTYLICSKCPSNVPATLE